MDFHHAHDAQHALQTQYALDAQGQHYPLDPQHQQYDQLQSQYDSQFSPQYTLDPTPHYGLDQQYLDSQTIHQYDVHGHQHGMDAQMPMATYNLDHQTTNLHSQHHMIDGQL